jgi:hypothetical protein
MQNYIMNDEYYRTTVNITSHGFFQTKFHCVKQKFPLMQRKQNAINFFSFPTIFAFCFISIGRRKQKGRLSVL